MKVNNPEPLTPSEYRYFIIEGNVSISSHELFSKWGFNNGSFDDFLDPVMLDDDTNTSTMETSFHVAMVKKYLMPAINTPITVREMSTSHNPIRITSVDGHDLDTDSVWRDLEFRPENVLDETEVNIPIRTYLEEAIEAGLKVIIELEPESGEFDVVKLSSKDELDAFIDKQ